MHNSKDAKIKVMGILNLDQRSQTNYGRFVDVDRAVRHAEEMYEQGADFIDIGAEPTNPKVQSRPSVAEELEKLIPVLEKLKGFPIPISIDTSQAIVMEETIKAGAQMINDVRALQEENALKTVISLNVPVCLMHMAYPFEFVDPVFENLSLMETLKKINEFLQQRINACLLAGMDPSHILIDPGFGHGFFGKTTLQNLFLLKNLKIFKEMGYPLLIGVSRKTFIGEILNLPPDKRLAGSLAATTIGVLNGANIIRTHDVQETREVIKLATAVMNVEC